MNGRARAFAPATVANVAVGFDILGFALEATGDAVAVSRVSGDPAVTIDSIEGVVTDLPRSAETNTAGAALLAMQAALGIRDGFRLSLEKGIPLGSGMGGSAASAVAAVVAANALLDRPLPREELLPFCLAGEAVASGAAHPDNAAASLYGGLVVVVGHEPPRVLPLPVPPGIVCVLVHPHLEIETRQARAALSADVPLSVAVRQSMHLSGFLVGCYRGDRELVGDSMVDLFAEPARAPLIPGFEAARRSALAAGALALAISGSGPSVFAWSATEHAGAVEKAVVAAFREAGLETDAWIGPVAENGARVVPESD